jgi:hypothetical protein
MPSIHDTDFDFDAWVALNQFAGREERGAHSGEVASTTLASPSLTHVSEKIPGSPQSEHSGQSEDTKLAHLVAASLRRQREKQIKKMRTRGAHESHVRHPGRQRQYLDEETERVSRIMMGAIAVTKE